METHSKCLIIVATASAMLLATCCWQHTTHSVAVCLPLEVDELHLDGERERARQNVHIVMQYLLLQPMIIMMMMIMMIFHLVATAYERDLVEAIQAQEGSRSLLLLQFHVLVHEIVSVYYYLPSFDTTQIAMVCYGMV